MRPWIRAFLLTLVALALPGDPARAEADGPDYWRVTGVGRNDVLNMRASPSASARLLARIPYDARGLKSLGCKGGPTFAQWQKMTPAEREKSARQRWCKVVFNGRSGWVAGRFLAEDGPPADGAAAPGVAPARTFGAWTVVCAAAACRSS